MRISSNPLKWHPGEKWVLVPPKLEIIQQTPVGHTFQWSRPKLIDGFIEIAGIWFPNVELGFARPFYSPYADLPQADYTLTEVTQEIPSDGNIWQALWDLKTRQEFAFEDVTVISPVRKREKNKLEVCFQTYSFVRGYNVIVDLRGWDLFSREGELPLILEEK